MKENLMFHGEFLKKVKICEQGKNFYEFCIIHIQKLIDFKNKEVKYTRILQVLKKILEDLQNFIQKGLLVTLLIDVKNLFYDKSCVFSKGSTWHQSPCAAVEGNGSK